MDAAAPIELGTRVIRAHLARPRRTFAGDSRADRATRYWPVARSIDITRITRSALSGGGVVLGLPYRFCRRT